MESKIVRVKRGVVVEDKAEKTVTVLIERVKEHPIYKKKFSVSKKYRAHDEENQYKIGDVVEIVSTRPLSKNKKYKVLRKAE